MIQNQLTKKYNLKVYEFKVDLIKNSIIRTVESVSKKIQLKEFMNLMFI